MLLRGRNETTGAVRRDPGPQAALLRRLGWLGVVATALLCGSSVCRATVSGVNYELTPAVEYFNWEDGVGLEDDALYGGRLSINFGRYLGLQSYYLRNNEIDGVFESTGLDVGMPLADLNRGIRVANYGADLVLSLSEGNVIPYLQAGGGVLDFDPTANDDFRTVALRAGGGLRFGLGDRLLGTIYVEDSMFRLDRAGLFPVQDEDVDLGEITDPDSDDLRHNLIVGAGVSFFLGGYDRSEETELDRAFRQRYQGGLSGLSVPLEPFVGQLDFADDVGLPNQDMLGLRTGMDFGPLFGLRAFYWKGMKDDFAESADIQSWGGEAQLNLSPGPGISPYLLIGGAQIDFDQDFTDPEGRPRSDRTALILGGGLEFSIGQHFDIELAARDYVFGEQDLEDVRNPDALHNNIAWTAGLNFDFGGGGPDAEQIHSIGRDRYGQSSRSAQDAGIDRSSGQTDLANEPHRRSRTDDGVSYEQTGDRTRSNGDDGALKEDGAERSRPSDGRTMLVPVPTTGEVYLRYGQPGGVSIESQNQSREGARSAGGRSGSGASRGDTADQIQMDRIEGVVARTVRDELRNYGADAATDTKSGSSTESASPPSQAAERGSGLDDNDLELLERRISDRIGSEMQAGLDDLRASIERLEVRRAATADAAPAAPAASSLPRSSDTHWDSPNRRDSSESPSLQGNEPRTNAGNHQSGEAPGLELNDIRTFTGAGFESPSQWILGARLDLGPISDGSSLRFEPEIAYGAADNSSFMVAGNLVWRATGLLRDYDVEPYLLGGFGILNFEDDPSGRDGTEGVLNLGYGLSKDLGRTRGFIEHEGIDMFSINRLLLGISFEL